MAEAGSYYRRLGKGYQRAIQRGMIKAGAQAITILHEKTETAPPASPRGSVGAFSDGTYKRGWKVSGGPGPNSFRTFNTVPYAPIIEYGRRPGGWSPRGGRRGRSSGGTSQYIQALSRWILRKGLVGKLKPNGSRSRASQERQITSMAFAIAKSIANRGLQPRYVLTRSIRPIQEAIVKQIRQECKNAIQAMGAA